MGVSDLSVWRMMGHYRRFPETGGRRQRQLPLVQGATWHPAQEVVLLQVPMALIVRC